MYSDYTIMHTEKAINLNSAHVLHVNSPNFYACLSRSLADLKKSLVDSSGHGVC